MKALKPRHLLLGAALAAAAALVLFGDRGPDAEVAEAVERPAARLVPTATLQPAQHAAATPARGGADQGQAILALVPRELLIGDSDSGFGQDQNGVFGR